MTEKPGPFSIFRMGLAVVQGLLGLFGAGSVLIGAHQLFLRYYAAEWAGIQLSGVNGCAGEQMIADGDLFSGQTFCNQPLNFVPWVVLYQRHWQAAAIYYGLILTALILTGLLVLRLQRGGSTKPFGGGVDSAATPDAEHLR